MGMHAEKQTNENGLAWFWSAAMAVVAGLIRLVPHPMNFTPVGALGLFGGARLRSWWAYALPLTVMAVTDLLLWAIIGHRDFSLLKYAFDLWVYASFLLAVLWGRLFLRRGGIGRLAAVSALVSVQFFLVTNFGVWLSASVDPQTLPDGAAVVFQDNPKFPAPVPLQYARNVSGLIGCYVAALPFIGTNAPPLGFFGNQLVGDWFYSALLFGAYAWLCGTIGLRRLRTLAPSRMT